jgi:hypothetical protein
MRKLINVLVIGLACCTASRAWSQSTIFTYQGRLSVNGSPANGLYDFRFTIHKIESGGEIIAGPKTNTAVQVTGGLFTIPLDFGHEPFLGVNRFLDIGVRANGSPNGFTSIQPRVRFASAPYAIAAANVIDGAVTASSLSPGPGAEGQVLQMSNGVLIWGAGGAGGTNSSVTMAGDVTGPSTSATVARIRHINVSAVAPAANQHLRYNGTDWVPSAVALGTDVSGALPVANGGTGAATPATARALLGAAGSGANADITSLSALTTPLSASQGGSGQNTYNPGDILYASAPNILSRRPIGTSGQVLSVSGGVPVWGPINNHNHFGQFWSGVATDGLFLSNTSSVPGSSALTGASWATNDIAYGLFGQTASSEGVGVQGFAFASSGLTTGVLGESTSTNGTGVYGFGSASSGQPIGVYGESGGPQGIGVYGIGAATNGTPVGVYGTISTPGGYGLYTPNRLYVGQSATVVGNLVAGTFFGNGAGLSNIVATATNTAGARILAASGTAASPGISFASSTAAGIFNPAVNVLSLGTSGTERMRVAADGKVGIGRVPAANTLEVEGTASKSSSGNWSANSDARIKKDVRNLDHALDKIDRVRPVSFRYTDEYRAAHPSLEDKDYLNVIAQEFAKVFPEAVKESGETLDGKPILQVDIHPAAVYSIAAIQELHHLVKAKDEEVTKLKQQNATLEHRLQALEKAVERLGR